MNDYRLRIYKEYVQCFCGGEWDRTSYPVWIYQVYDEESGVTIETEERNTEQQAREAGEKALEKWRTRGW